MASKSLRRKTGRGEYDYDYEYDYAWFLFSKKIFAEQKIFFAKLVIFCCHFLLIFRQKMTVMNVKPHGAVAQLLHKS